MEKGKIIYITESQINKFKKQILNENRESKNINLARKFLISNGYSQEQAQKVLDSIRTDIPNSRLAQCKFLLGVTRMYLDNQLQDGNSIMSLNAVLKYIASDAHINEYDNNLSNYSVNDLVDRFQSVQTNDLNSDKENLSNNQYQENNRYTIVRIPDFETASKFSKYTSWCITYDRGMYNSYTHGGIGIFYFCLRNDFTSVERVKGENCPLDDYGLSMLAVSVNKDGSLNTCTCRWNHEMDGTDSIMNTQQISELIGKNFYNVFLPRTDEEIIENERKIYTVYESLLNTLPEVIYDEVGDIDVDELSYMFPDYDMTECYDITEGVYSIGINSKNALYFYKSNNYLRDNKGNIIFYDYIINFDFEWEKIALLIENYTLYINLSEQKIVKNGFEKYTFETYPIERSYQNVALKIKNIQNHPYVIFDKDTMMPRFNDGEFFGRCEPMYDMNRMRVSITNESIRFYIYDTGEIFLEENSKNHIENINDLQQTIDFTRTLTYQDAKFIDENAIINVRFEHTNKKGRLIVENRESKNINLARKYLINNGYNQENAQKVLDAVRTDIPNSRVAQCKFLLGIVRMYLNQQLTDQHTIGSLNNILKYIGNETHVDEYNNDLNGENAQTLINRFAKAVTDDLNTDKENISKENYQANNDYQIVKINSFEEAEKYGDYTTWCVTHQECMYNSYTNNGMRVFYFCLKNGFENIEEKVGKNCPLDEYGLSMIAISVNENGSLNTCTCRWNHDNGGNDNIMSTKQISQLLGVNFYQTFLPLSNEEIQEKRMKINSDFFNILETVNRGNGNLNEYFGNVDDVNNNCFMVSLSYDDDLYAFVITNNEDEDYFNTYQYLLDKDDNVILYKNYSELADYLISLVESNGKSYVYNTKDNYILCNLPNESILFKLLLERDGYENSNGLFKIFLNEDYNSFKIYNLYNKKIYDEIFPNTAINFEMIGSHILRYGDYNDYRKQKYFDIEKESYIQNPYLSEYASVDSLIYSLSKVTNNEGLKNVIDERNGELLFKDNWFYDIRLEYDNYRAFLIIYFSPNSCNITRIYRNDYKEIDFLFPKNLKEIEYVDSESSDSGFQIFGIDKNNIRVVYDSNEDKVMYLNNESIVKENNEFEVYPSEVDVTTVDKKNELNPKFWHNYTLNPKVRLKLLDIADDFWFDLNLDWVEVKDIIITGSICNFNWSKYSDIDLHILIDYNDVDSNIELVKDFFYTKKNEWSTNHINLSIYGFPIEIYVQDINEPHKSSAIYSLEKNKWLIKPSENNMDKIGEDKEEIQEKAAMLMTIIDNIDKKLFLYKKDKIKLRLLLKKINSFAAKLSKMRKNGLYGKDGEMSVNNLVYKLLRQKGYIDRIYKLKYTCFDLLNSINERRF